MLINLGPCIELAAPLLILTCGLNDSSELVVHIESCRSALSRGEFLIGVLIALLSMPAAFISFSLVTVPLL